jgi:hypothetical protein
MCYLFLFLHYWLGHTIKTTFFVGRDGAIEEKIKQN